MSNQAPPHQSQPKQTPPNRIAGVETRHIHDWFGRFAVAASTWLGSTWAFAAAALIVAVWFAVGPINTGIALATLFMVFLIQNMQNRDARAINLKLNELIRAIDKARNQMIDIERLTDAELDDLQATYEKVKTAWSERHARHPADRTGRAEEQ